MQSIDNNKVKTRLWHKVKNMSPQAKRNAVDIIKIGSIALLSILISIVGFIGVRYLDNIDTKLATFNKNLNDINITVTEIKAKQTNIDAISANCVNNINTLDEKITTLSSTVNRLDVTVADLKDNYRRKLLR